MGKQSVAFNKARAITQSIAHWERMVAWAKGQGDSRIGGYGYGPMCAELNESPTGLYCALCKINHDFCYGCPLDTVGNCNLDDSLYRMAYYSVYWPDFVKHGKRLIKQLKSL